jgi:hypothetical protein
MKGNEPMPDENKPPQTTTPQNTTQPQTPAGPPAEKPAEPSNILFKGSQEPPKTPIIHLVKIETTHRDESNKK